MKLIGAFEMHNLLRGLSGMSLRMFSKGFGWTREEIEIYLAGVRKDIQNMSYHTYWDLYVLYHFPFLPPSHLLGRSPRQALRTPMTCSNMLVRYDHC